MSQYLFAGNLRLPFSEKFQNPSLINRRNLISPDFSSNLSRLVSLLWPFSLLWNRPALSSFSPSFPRFPADQRRDHFARRYARISSCDDPSAIKRLRRLLLRRHRVQWIRVTPEDDDGLDHRAELRGWPNVPRFFLTNELSRQRAPKLALALLFQSLRAWKARKRNGLRYQQTTKSRHSFDRF